MERLKTSSHQSRALEWGLVFLFILVLSWVVLSRYEAMEARAVHTVARYEYQLLQTRIQIYRLRNGKWPPKLADALGGEPESVLFVGINPKRRRLLDEQGRLNNPYGEPYAYDPATGTLKKPAQLSAQKATD